MRFVRPLLAAGVLSLPASGQGTLGPAAPPPTWAVERAKLTSSQPDPVGQFGRAVDLHGDLLVVGASHEWAGAPYAGSATVLRRRGGAVVEEARLEHPAPTAGAVFGTSVAVHGERVAVGAPLDDGAGYNAGAVFVFARAGGGWTLEATLSGADGGADDHFGIALALAGDELLVGAHGHDGAGLDAGAAYLFRRGAGGWRELWRWTPAAGADGARFGHAVDLGDGRAIVGAPYEAGTGPAAGAAYVFETTGGTLEARLEHAPASGLHLGAAVAVDGGRAAVGATGTSAAGAHAGAVHLFELAGGAWTSAGVVHGHDTGPFDRFGHALDLRGSRLLVGAHRNGALEHESGAAYVFALGTTGVAQLGAIRPNDAQADDLFGASVALGDGLALVGAVLEDEAAYDAGAAYLFGIP